MNDCTYNSQYFDIDDNISGSGENITNVNASKLPENEENTTNEEDEETLWSIDDDTLFYPLGLINHGTGSKSVFVTWSENYLLNFVFKKSEKTQRTKLTKVRLDVHAEEITQILILELNTLLLMRSGRVFHFSSVKSMHPVKWLSNVRCISSSLSGFSLIRLLLPENTLRLELYQDVTSIDRSENTLLNSYDITFDEANLFNCQWENERFTILSQTIDEGNLSFLELILRNKTKLNNKPEIHFFTVSGSIFVLIPDVDTDDYDIHLCATYPTNVEFIKILCKRRMVLIFLQCGTIEVWYYSYVSRGLEKIVHSTGSQYIDYEFANSNESFYYTDNDKVAQLRFHYNETTDTCMVLESTKAVYGILACTWMESIQQLICLSSNNIFYQLAFEETNEVISDCESFSELYELTPLKITQLLDKAHILNELQGLPNQIHKSIEREFVTQELIAVGTKLKLYQKLFQARLEYRMHLPVEIQNDNMLIYTKSHCVLSNESLFALIYLRIENNVIFASTRWNLHIKYNANCNIFSITQEMLKNNLCIVIPLYRRKQELLPQFEICLNAFVNIDSDFVAISLPIHLQDSNCIKCLITNKPCRLSTQVDETIPKLIQNFYKTPSKESESLLTCKLSLSKECDVKTILRLFNVNQNSMENVFHIYFMSINVQLTPCLEENCIKIECMDAAVLYYVKLFILNGIKSIRRFLTPAELNTRRECIMEFQAEVERCYGTLMDGDNVGNSCLHLENLLRIYRKLRKDLDKTVL